MSTSESLPPHIAVEIPMEGIGNGSQAGPSTGGGGQSLGEFFKEVNAIQEMIRNIKENMSGIEALHKRTLATVTDDESSRMSRQLDLLISETSRIAGQISNKLTLMEQNNKTLQDQTQIRLTQHATLAKSFIDTMTNYLQMQMENEKKYKERIARQFRIVKPDVTQQEIDQLLSEESGQKLTAQVLSKTQSEQSRAVLTEVQDRQRDILRIEKSITELSKMFNKVKSLVLEEDTKVKKISNSADNNMNQGEQYTTPTMKVARRIRKKKWKLLGLILLLLIIAAIIVISVVLTR